MKDRRFDILILYTLIAWLIFFLSPMGLASDGSVMRTQGLINPGGNLKAGYLMINEMKVYINQLTQVMDHRKMPIPIIELKPKRWVYMEIEKDSSQKIIIMRKIYLLPHYVNPEEKRKFPFMKQ